MTEYLIFEKTKDGFWSETGKSVASSSARAAVRSALSGANGSEGTFVAIPARSWQPLTATKETKLTLK